jgi:hypothetical protein
MKKLYALTQNEFCRSAFKLNILVKNYSHFAPPENKKQTTLI